MPKPSSSTSSSDSEAAQTADAAGRAFRWPSDLRDLLVVALGLVIAWAAIDVGLAVALGSLERSHAADARGPIATVRSYFEFGRSIEGKLRRHIGDDDASAHPAMRAGWRLSPERVAKLPAKPAGPGQVLVAGYGMSFAEHVLRELDGWMTVRFVGGPASTLGHSYYRYLEDRDRHAAKVVVLGVLASSFTAFDSMSHMTWHFEAPSPHLYPRFFLEDGELRRIEPLLESAAELRAALADPEQWQAVVDQLAVHDAFFEPLVFGADIADHSPLARTLRRAWGHKRLRETQAIMHGAAGFTNATGAVDTGRAILEQFAADVRGRGQLPVVILFDNRGYADHLYQALGVWLESKGVPVLSTHNIAPASDLGSFLPDGHFIPAVDQQLGRELQRLLAENGLERPAG